MDDTTRRKRIRKLIIGGAVLGAVLSIAVAILMDVLYAEALQGTWRDAIVNDLHRLLSVSLPPDSILVYALFAIVLLFLSAIGAVIGIVFVFIIGRFLSFIGS